MKYTTRRENQSRSQIHAQWTKEIIIKMIIASAKGTLEEEYGVAWEETVNALLN